MRRFGKGPPYGGWNKAATDRLESAAASGAAKRSGAVPARSSRPAVPIAMRPTPAGSGTNESPDEASATRAVDVASSAAICAPGC